MSILITGASSGIGEAAARLFAAEGARVVLFARRADRLEQVAESIADAGGEAVAVPGDVRSMADMERAVGTAVDRHGGLDAAFNNAGYGTAGTVLHLMDDAAYDTTMDVNVRGVWNGLRAEITAMLRGGGGSIVNTSSVGGVLASSASAPYIAAKHAVIGLTRAAAAEYGEHGIRVNALVVGSTMTEMTRQAPARGVGPGARATPRGVQRRYADPVEVAQAARWLCSPASSFVTGSAMAVDGGRTAV
jgi:NAD(P)-dependent dehydrogenase (short-subunit alcohol dehydrogenase family)